MYLDKSYIYNASYLADVISRRANIDIENEEELWLSLCGTMRNTCLCVESSNRDCWIRCTCANFAIFSQVPAIFPTPANGSCRSRRPASSLNCSLPTFVLLKTEIFRQSLESQNWHLYCAYESLIHLNRFARSAIAIANTVHLHHVTTSCEWLKSHCCVVRLKRKRFTFTERKILLRICFTL